MKLCIEPKQVDETVAYGRISYMSSISLLVQRSWQPGVTLDTYGVNALKLWAKWGCYSSGWIIQTLNTTGGICLDGMCIGILHVGNS